MFYVDKITTNNNNHFKINVSKELVAAQIHTCQMNLR